MMTLPCTVLTLSETGAVGEGNNPEYTTSSTSGLCFLEQMKRGGGESTIGEDIVSDQWRWYGTPDLVVSATSIITVDGPVPLRLRVDGEPDYPYNPIKRRIEYVTALCSTSRVAA